MLDTEAAEYRRRIVKQSGREMVSSDFGDRLRAALDAHQVTPAQLQEKLGLSSQTVSYWCRGVRRLWSASQIADLAEVIGCSPSELDPRLANLPREAT
jgi:transcriptional regulator with XRE-family HTH domain